MLTEIFVSFVNLFILVFNILLLVRVLMSWVNPSPQGGLGGLIYELTEPILAPIRRVLPQGQMIDFSPLVAFAILWIIDRLVNTYLG